MHILHVLHGAEEIQDRQLCPHDPGLYSRNSTLWFRDKDDEQSQEESQGFQFRGG